MRFSCTIFKLFALFLMARVADYYLLNHRTPYGGSIETIRYRFFN